jgi:hypothetical protein
MVAELVYKVVGEEASTLNVTNNLELGSWSSLLLLTGHLKR